MKRVLLLFALVIVIFSGYAFSKRAESMGVPHWYEDGSISFIKEAPVKPLGVESPAKSYYIYNVTDERPVAGLNEEMKLAPASLTKIVSLYLIKPLIKDMDERIQVPEDLYLELMGKGSSMAGFVPGESVSIRDLFFGTMLPSGGEAINALAVHVSGSREAFVSRMNDAATSMALKSSSFRNPEGLDEEGHLSSAKDVTMVLRAALEDVFFREVFTTLEYTTSPTEHVPQGHLLRNRSLGILRELMTEIKVLGTKTGTTPEAGLCITGLIEKEGKEYLITLMGIEFEDYMDPSQIEFFKVLAEAI